jgi:hypothetical protein
MDAPAVGVTPVLSGARQPPRSVLRRSKNGIEPRSRRQLTFPGGAEQTSALGGKRTFLPNYPND